MSTIRQGAGGGKRADMEVLRGGQVFEFKMADGEGDGMQQPMDH